MEQFLITLKRLQSLPQNQNCFECGDVSREWASVNNGIFLCLRCAGVHRSLTVSVSFVRSVTMDKWSMQQVRMMQLGGNLRLRNLMDEFGISSNSSPQYKYNTKALIYYRQLLRSQVQGIQPPEKPSSFQGVKRQVRSNYRVQKEERIEPAEKQEFIDVAKEKLIFAGSKTKQVVTQLWEKGSKKYEETDFRGIARQTSTKIKDQVSKIDMKELGEKSKQAVSTGFQYSKTAAEYMFNKIKSFW